MGTIFFRLSSTFIPRNLSIYAIGGGGGVSSTTRTKTIGGVGGEAKYSGYYSNVNLKAGIGRMASGASPTRFL